MRTLRVLAGLPIFVIALVSCTKAQDPSSIDSGSGSPVGTETFQATESSAALKAAAANTPCPPGVDWSKVQAAWDEFLKKKQDAQLEQMLQLLPSQSVMRQARGCKGAPDASEAINQNTDTLADRMKAGSRTAIRLAFRLMGLAQGDFEETLDIELGGIIRVHPELFLDELHQYGGDSFCSDGLVGNTGPQLIDNPKDDLKEMKARLEALRGVKKPELKTLRDLCAQVLERLITREEESLKSMSADDEEGLGAGPADPSE